MNLGQKSVSMHNVCLAGIALPTCFHITVIKGAITECEACTLDQMHKSLKGKLEVALEGFAEFRRCLQEQITDESDMNNMGIFIAEAERVIREYIAKIKSRVTAEQEKAKDKVDKCSSCPIFEEFDELIEKEDFPGPYTEDLAKIIASDEGSSLYGACKQYDGCEEAACAIVKCIEQALVKSPDFGTLDGVSNDVQAIATAFEHSAGAMETFLQPLADLTVVQAGLRDLDQHETRASLAKKCRKGLARRRYMTARPKLMLWLQRLEDGEAA